jgi:hypothetical protein
MDGKCTDRRVPRVVAVHVDGDDGVRRLERPESRVRG